MNDRKEQVQRVVAGVVLVMVIGVFFTAQAAAFTHMHDWTMDVAPEGTDDWFGWSNAVISEVSPVAGMLALWLAVQQGRSRIMPGALVVYGLGISTIAQTAAAGSDPSPSTLFVTLLPAASAFILLKVGFGMLDLLGLGDPAQVPTATPAPATSSATPPVPATATPATLPATATPPVIEVAEPEVAEPTATPPVAPAAEVAEPEVAELAEVADDDTATLATVTPIHSATPPAATPARTGGPRNAEARKALELVAGGMSVADACEQTGAAVRTVERWAPQYRPTNELAAAGSRK